VRECGPIGVTFVPAGWLLGFSALVVAGAVGSAALVARRTQSTAQTA
jgi:hypothetical protein